MHYFLQRRRYTPVAPLTPRLADPLAERQGLAWFAGDFHVHCRESGDAFVSASVDEIATFATTQKLDFVHFSDHNTVSVADFILDAQERFPHLLLLPGVELTTYYGHGGALFTTKYVDHKLGLTNVTIEGAIDSIHQQGGLFSINHFNAFERGADLRNKCVGCTW